MTPLLLASWLLSQTWAWSTVGDTDVAAYRIYFSAGMTVWCPQDRVEIPASACGALECQAEVPEPQFSTAFFIVTAVDDAGNESSTEHGAVSMACP
jgi:hypothetical protein